MKPPSLALLEAGDDGCDRGIPWVSVVAEGKSGTPAAPIVVRNQLETGALHQVPVQLGEAACSAQLPWKMALVAVLRNSCNGYYTRPRATWEAPVAYERLAESLGG